MALSLLKGETIITMIAMDKYLEDMGSLVKRTYKWEPESLYPRLLSIQDYNKADVELTKYIERRMEDMTISIPELNNRKLTIKDVIFNDPATIVFWSDGTKTVVKAVNEDFDKEKGLAMAITKKFFGNKGNYYNNIKKWLD